jgi:catechol 2,3-dioxygenase-like lactoylglutathione lyase family enzyme
MNARLDVIGLVVADMARSLAFYRELGLDVPADADTQPHVEVSLPGGLRLTWDTADEIRKFDSSWTAPTGSPRASLAFAFDAPDEVDRAYEHLTGLGHEGHLPPWDAFWGQHYATLHDPDGNGVDLFAALPTGG